MGTKYRGHEARPTSVEVVDLTANKITDLGIEALARFLKQHAVCCMQLRPQGNPLSPPTAIAELLKDRWAGIPGGFRELHISARSFSHESLWRILEACVIHRPRPPVRLFFRGWRDGASGRGFASS